MNKETMIRVLIADHHTNIRERLIAVFADYPDIEVCAQAQSGSETIALFRFHQPQVALVALHMPQMDGIAAIRTLHTEFPTACLLGLIAFDSEPLVMHALAAGATHCLLNRTPHAHMVALIRSLHHKRYVSLIH